MKQPVSSVDDLPAGALALLRDCQQRDYFQGLDWLRNFCANGLEPDAQARLIAAEGSHDGKPCHGLLALRTPPGQPGAFVEGWKAAGRGLASLTSYQSTRFALHLPADNATHPPLARALSAKLTATAAPALLDINLLEPASAGIEEFRSALEADGYETEPYVYSHNQFESVAGLSFAEFLACRPSQVHKTYTRKARQLARKHDCRFRVLAASENLDAALADYEAVLAGSWKDVEPFPLFTRQLIRDAAVAGVLRLGLLYVDDKPVAAQLWIVSNGRATIYKLHYLETMAKQAVGAVLSLNMCEHALEVDEVAEIDFGVGNEAHKVAWLAESRPLTGLLAFERSSLLGRYLRSKHHTRARLREFRSTLRQQFKPR